MIGLAELRSLVIFAAIWTIVFSFRQIFWNPLEAVVADLSGSTPIYDYVFLSEHFVFVVDQLEACNENRRNTEKAFG